jgi:hypothetical protein
LPCEDTGTESRLIIVAREKGTYVRVFKVIESTMGGQA